MKNLVALYVALALLSGSAVAENSIIIGQGIKVESVGDSTDGWIAGYVWLIDARKTVSGPIIKGKIRIVAESHAQPTDSYLKSVQLFVLSPIVNARVDSNRGPSYSLIASSPLYDKGKFCVPFRPSDIGIRLSNSEIERDQDNDYCFTKKALLKATEHKAPNNSFESDALKTTRASS